MSDGVKESALAEAAAEKVNAGTGTPAKDKPAAQDDDPPESSWQKHNWTVAVILLFITMLALLYIVWENTTGILAVVSRYEGKDNSFVFGGLSLVTLTLIRMLAILIGAALAFAGLAISFFSHDKATEVAASSTSPGATTAATLTAYSPGIVGVVFGAIVIMAALLNRTIYNYTPPQTVTTQFRVDAASTSHDEVARAAASLGLEPAEKVISTSAAKSPAQPGDNDDGKAGQ